MFAIFYLLFNQVTFGIAKIKENIDNENSRDRAIKNGDLTYYGTNGERLVSNNKNVYRKKNNGDDVLVDLYTGEIYKNYSEEVRKNKECKAKKQGETVVFVHYEENQEYIRSERFKAKTISITPEFRDIETRRFYISAYLNGLSFYMDIITGELIRLQDGEDTSQKWGNLSVEDIINIFNQRQKNMSQISQSSHNFMWWEQHFYLKYNGFDTLFIDDDKNIIEGNYKRDFKVKELRNKLIKEGEQHE